MIKLSDIQEDIYELNETESVGELSDGYHTFNELYHHRAILSAALFRQIPFTWKSKIHEDGTMFDGMFIVGVATPDGFATYHYNLPYWDTFKVPVLPHAPKFDGHTPQDAINRIEKWFTRGILIYDEKDMEGIDGPLSDILECFNNDEDKDTYIRTWIKK